MNNIDQKFYNITLEDCLNIPFEQSFKMLEKLIPKRELELALDISKHYPSPLRNNKNTKWTQTAKIIGINPRITKTYWGIIKYAMIFPENCIHLMPLWETGDGSLYVQNSWNLNKDFFDEDLSKLGYNTVEKQLKLIINILHSLGKIVGFDCLPHVDNFSEIVLTNPKYFEWIKLNNLKTSQIFDIDTNNIYKEIEKIIIQEINAPENLYDLEEKERYNIIFHKNVDNYTQRMNLRKQIRNNGYEPIPVVEHSPMRPVIFDKIESKNDENWAKFVVKDKSSHAKIFGNITPYKWYKISKDGYPIKNNLEKDVWDYFINKINDFQSEYNFDFLRADMAHNQISHSHNDEKDEHSIEMWKVLKDLIHKNKPYFATFAEAFYGNYYINGIQDMQNKNFDIVLGNMNFKEINEDYFNWLDDFINPFAKNFNFYPCVTIFTNDGDLQEHRHLYSDNNMNMLRYFISIFLKLPSYMGIGFETKSCNPISNNEYSNYSTLKQNNYVFGENNNLFIFINKMREFYIQFQQIIQNCNVEILDFNSKDIFGWMYENKLIFIAKIKDIPISIAGCDNIYKTSFCEIYKVNP